MFIGDDAFENVEGFRSLLPAVHSRYDLGTEEDPEIWALRAYALREASRNPVGLFLHLLRDRHSWNRPQAQDWRQGERDRLGDDAATTMLTREELLKEIVTYAGEILPDGTEILRMGIETKARGLESWEKVGTAALEKMVRLLRDPAQRGELPEYLTPQQAARALGGKSLSELIRKA